MHLNERDRSDLLGLVSGFGSAESLNRARLLATANPEAADYLRQMGLIADAFRPPAVLQPTETLSPEEVDRLTDEVLARVAGRAGLLRYPASRPVLWRPPALGAAAAVLLIAFCGTWVVWTTTSVDHQTPPGTLVFVPQSAAGGMPYEQGPVVVGQMVTAPANAFARVTMPNGTLVVLESLSGARINEDGRSLVLHQGAFRVCAKDPTTVRVEDLTLVLRSGVSWIMVRQSGVAAFVFEGSATLSAGGQSRELVAGEVADWNKETRKLRVTQSSIAAPSWVDDLREAAGGR
jgi:hypothetical protein